MSYSFCKDNLDSILTERGMGAAFQDFMGELLAEEHDNISVYPALGKYGAIDISKQLTPCPPYQLIRQNAIPLAMLLLTTVMLIFWLKIVSLWNLKLLRLSLMDTRHNYSTTLRPLNTKLDCCSTLAQSQSSFEKFLPKTTKRVAERFWNELQ